MIDQWAVTCTNTGAQPRRIFCSALPNVLLIGMSSPRVVVTPRGKLQTRMASSGNGLEIQKVKKFPVKQILSHWKSEISHCEKRMMDGSSED